MLELIPNSTKLLYFDATYFILLLINTPLIQTPSYYLMPSVVSQFIVHDIQISSRDVLWSHKQRIIPIREWLRHRVIDKANKYLGVSNQSVVICKGGNKTADISAIYHVSKLSLCVPVVLLINYPASLSDVVYVFNYAFS